MSSLNEKLVSLIKPLIKQELKNFSKILAPIIKEQVEKSVNKILAEQFIRGLSNQTSSSLGNVFTEKLEGKASFVEAPDKNELALKQKKAMRERYEEKMKNLNVPKEEWHLFENLPAGGIGGNPGSQVPGLIGDGDDEGVDLSAFGL